MPRGRTGAPARWRWLLPLLVLGLALGVLALHQLSHGRSLVATDPAVAGHHAKSTVVRSAAPGATVDATAHGHGVADQRDSHPLCGQLCGHPASVMVCLLALVLLAGCRLLRGPAEARWFAFSWAARRLGLRIAVECRRLARAPSVSLLSLGISRT